METSNEPILIHTMKKPRGVLLIQVFKVLLTILFVSLAFLHAIVKSIQIDSIFLILLCMAILPWIMEVVSKLKISGFEVEFKKLTEKIENQQQELESQRKDLLEIVKYSMSESIYTHLWKISTHTEYLYYDNDPFRREMYFLRDAGYIEGIDKKFIDFNKELGGQNLCKIVCLTPIGKKIVGLRGFPR